jgi:Opioid growth factor receptor (OGFr) conserved region
MNSQLLEFYRGRGPDAAGRRLADVQAMDNVTLEQTHDYIQWLFPLPEPSNFNRHAPVLTGAEMKAFRHESELRAGLISSCEIMLRFYGLKWSEHTSLVELSDLFQERASEWLTPGNHNFLRITRILRSLTLLGAPERASALLRCLEGIYQRYHEVIGAKTLGFWRRATDPSEIAG